jgi:hypothetical protein
MRERSAIIRAWQKTRNKPDFNQLARKIVD